MSKLLVSTPQKPQVCARVARMLQLTRRSVRHSLWPESALARVLDVTNFRRHKICGQLAHRCRHAWLSPSINLSSRTLFSNLRNSWKFAKSPNLRSSLWRLIHTCCWLQPLLRSGAGFNLDHLGHKTTRCQVFSVDLIITSFVVFTSRQEAHSCHKSECTLSPFIMIWNYRQLAAISLWGGTDFFGSIEICLVGLGIQGQINPESWIDTKYSHSLPMLTVRVFCRFPPSHVLQQIQTKSVEVLAFLETRTVLTYVLHSSLGEIAQLVRLKWKWRVKLAEEAFSSAFSAQEVETFGRTH